MNKQELSSKIAETLSTTKKESESFVNAFVDAVTEELSNGGEVKIAGFGTFSVTERSAREGRNPQTGESMHIEASKSPKFKALGALKNAVK